MESLNMDKVEKAIAKAYSFAQGLDKSVNSAAAAAEKLAASMSRVTSGARDRAGGGSGNYGGAKEGNLMANSLGNVPEMPPSKRSAGDSTRTTPTGSSTGGSNAGGASFGGSGGGKAPVSTGAGSGGGVSGTRVGAIAAGVANFAWNMTPGAEDNLSLVTSLFPAAYANAGSYDRMATGRRVLADIGSGASGTLDPYAAASLLGSRGFGYSNRFNDSSMMMQAASFSYKMSGMSNIAAAEGVSSIYHGASDINDVLYSIGIQTVNPDGSLVDPGTIVKQIYERSFAGASPDRDTFERELAMGYFGNNLRQIFGSNPAAMQQAVDMARTMNKTGNSNLKIGDGSFDSAASGVGMNDSPWATVTGPMNSSRSNFLLESSEGGYLGDQAASAVVSAINNAAAELTEALGVASDTFNFFKSFGEAMTSFFTSGFSAGGNVESFSGSTTDSIKARLSHGEYVINARAAKMIGRETLEQMNSLGQDFGEGFASPAPAFLAKGGGPDWTHPFPHAKVHVSSGFRPADRPYHGAVDLNIPGERADEGKSVLAAASGTIIGVDHNSGSGGIVRIKHAGGYVTGYHHLGYNSIGVKVGDDVVAGQLLGLIGKHGSGDREGTGLNSSGAHLHFSVKKGNKFINPMSFLTGAPMLDNAVEAVGSIAGNAKEAMTNFDTGFISDFLQSLLGESGSKTSLDPVQGVRANPFSILQSFSLGGLTDKNGILGAIGGAMESPMFKQGASSPLGSGLALLGGVGAVLGMLGGLLTGVMGGGLLSNSTKDNSDAHSRSGGEYVMGGKKYKHSESMAPADLLATLQRAGFKGQRLREAYAIVMRESNARPMAMNPRGRDESYGMFQINFHPSGLDPEKREAALRKNVPGYKDRTSLYDPDIAARAAAYMSRKGKDWSSWVSPQYGKAKDHYDDFPGVARKAGLPGYAMGSEYVSRDQVAKLHQGEMVFPAAQAQMFREVMQEVLSGNRGGPKEVTINMNIERASDEEAERFAKRVVAIINNSEQQKRLSSL